MEYDNSYPMAAGNSIGYSEQAAMKMASQPTLQQRLDSAVRQAEERLEAVKKAREIFQRNPDMETLLNIMQRGLF